MHTHGSGGRRRGKPRSRILYWFRTPPGVRIGRSALDEDAIRLIEQHNPDVEFDWTRILKGQDGTGTRGQTPGTEGQTPGTEGQTPRSSEARGSSQQDRRIRPRPSDVSPASQDARPPVPVIDAPQDPQEFVEEAVEGAPPAIEPTPMKEPEERSDAIEPADIAVVEEFLVEPRVEPPAPRPQPGDALSVVEARLGSEGLSRLRARYSEVLARISETVSDPARQEELKATAERLNPDTWVTEAEVGAGLEDYESVFESLRSVVGRRRRRGRRSAHRRNRSPDASQQDSTAAEQDVEESDDPGPAEEQ